jgi:CRP-like cAMP-binding protein
MQFVEVPKDTMFIKQNTIGSLFYVLKQGKVKVIVNNQVFGEMQAPKAFGERALFNDFIRAASIVTLSTCYLYVLPRDSFLKIYQIINKTQGLDQKKNFLENHYTLSNSF